MVCYGVLCFFCRRVGSAWVDAESAWVDAKRLLFNQNRLSKQSRHYRQCKMVIRGHLLTELCGAYNVRRGRPCNFRAIGYCADMDIPLCRFHIHPRASNVLTAQQGSALYGNASDTDDEETVVGSSEVTSSTTSMVCCVICHSARDTHLLVKCIPCEHGYHRDCIDRWCATSIEQGSAPSCPCCRAEIQDVVPLADGHAPHGLPHGLSDSADSGDGLPHGLPDSADSGDGLPHGLPDPGDGLPHGHAPLHGLPCGHAPLHGLPRDIGPLPPDASYVGDGHFTPTVEVFSLPYLYSIVL